MNIGTIHQLDTISCRKALNETWNQVCDIVPHRRGLAIALPVLLADGWQATLYAEEEMPGYVTLRDRGQMDSWLYTHGVNLNNAANQSILTKTRKIYGIDIDSLGFYKTIRLPMKAVEIQLFACFLSSVSHLVNRVQKQGIEHSSSYNAVIQTASSLQLPYTERKAYETRHRKLIVDISIEGLQRTALVQTFDQRGHNATESMELWSSRLPEIAETTTGEQKYTTALIYNEDYCNITPEILSLAKERCNLVCPSHRRDELEDYLRQNLAS